jgi:hypothetical protein
VVSNQKRACFCSDCRPLEGAIAQLGERVLCKHEVVGSIPSGSTILFGAAFGIGSSGR